MNTEKIKKDWQQRGFSFGIWDDPPGQVWEDFIHEVDELFMLDEGEVTLIIDEREIKAIQGEEILIPAMSRHTVRTSHQGSSRWFYGYKNKK